MVGGLGFWGYLWFGPEGVYPPRTEQRRGATSCVAASEKVRCAKIIVILIFTTIVGTHLRVNLQLQSSPCPVGTLVIVIAPQAR